MLTNKEASELMVTILIFMGACAVAIFLLIYLITFAINLIN